MPRSRGRRTLTAEEIAQVKAWAAVGVPQKDMVVMLHVNPDGSDDLTAFRRLVKTNEALRSALATERHAHSKARHTLYQMAVEEKNPRMLEFYCKTQLGMSYTEKLELTGAVDVSAITDEELERRTAKIIARMAGRKSVKTDDT